MKNIDNEFTKLEYATGQRIHNERVCKNECEYHKNQPRQYPKDSGVAKPTKVDTTMNKDSIPAKNIEDKIADVVEKALKSFGFVKAERNCFTPKYGDSAYIIEYWDAKKVGVFIRQDLETLINQEIKAVLNRLKELNEDALYAKDYFQNPSPAAIHKLLIHQAIEAEIKKITKGQANVSIQE